ncbi:hypothetical protein BJ508DRAFT_110909 [Ascobolus immersus RN42]|uniref:Uncharacterized protein n=1 Tax=Ascobolus immersus RN42 TaxID=1160509 RepID=A0A3N4IBL4_ASCIM|nr:hypothetical protein BJ508DRAFT_110909 [Ascobolus immersus RN42]
MASTSTSNKLWALAYKIGMSSRFKPDGTRLPITILQLSDMRKRYGTTRWSLVDGGLRRWVEVETEERGQLMEITDRPTEG